MIFAGPSHPVPPRAVLGTGGTAGPSGGRFWPRNSRIRRALRSGTLTAARGIARRRNPGALAGTMSTHGAAIGAEAAPRRHVDEFSAALGTGPGDSLPACSRVAIELPDLGR